MPTALLLKLFAIFGIVAIGWLAGRFDRLGARESGGDASRILSNAAFYIFVPALLLRTTARIDFAALPWRTLFVFFTPAVLLMLLVYAVQRPRCRAQGLPVAAPAVRAITAAFGNSVQVGIPLVTALFGEAGLAIHVTIVSLHALVIVSLATTLVELDLARARPGAQAKLYSALLRTARNTVVHPVVLPVLCGLAWNLSGLPWPELVDDMLRTLGQAVVPLCLLLIGLSLAHHGVRGALWPAAWLSALKLFVMPLMVYLLGRYGFHLSGLPLAVATLCAALPIGSNALIFAQRYRALEAETAAASVLSTLAFVGSVAIWLGILAL